uniref:SET domain-containing protein n=1 Tax=Rhodosorus marinus TaxID=101924 RepID=A0A7S3EP57_9RHOD|mmetsp:Transcript_9991/g.42151  ORF Transcript_9991/g.42151 Transcript_9991/m.42151 type:complete len:448 (+) Transcript_9991:679-2022(+)|eukprot:CAMPEP_0113960450 /NCGR_PEP_ID=MMETSP0011_2-20120614/4716_1 /TAXON_ID=101924 /ORGANISM="Rhodosorus marinus" /LENGTH=447 /DNA_ID=CAMNT_0000971893 /DNA_START=195 /DNA_END=1538 /DNA_ORIENTATION=+ /assembly_acc=CAM_ASM_000156
MAACAFLGLGTPNKSGVTFRRKCCFMSASSSSPLSWARDGGIQWNVMNLHTFAGNVRGMIAEQDFDASSAIVKVPKEMVLESNSIPETNPIPSFVTSSYWKSQRWWVRLALRLVYQKQTDKKPNLSGYVNALPKTFSTPFHWTAEELQETQYIPIQKQVVNQQQEWKRLHRLLTENLKDERSVEFDEFVWALECVRSRAFSGEAEATPFGERLKTIAFAGALSVAALTLHLADSEQVLNGLSLAVIALLSYDLIYPRVQKAIGGEEWKRYILCPIIDFCNHSSRAESDISYEYFFSSFVLKTGPYKKGEQVFISYGDRSNDQLLQYYGFVEENNPHDVYVVGETLQSVLDSLDIDSADLSDQEKEYGPVVLFRSTLNFDTSVQKSVSKLFGEEGIKHFAEQVCLRELENMPTTLEEDEGLKKKSIAVQFRIQKKRLLTDILKESREQ